MKKQLTIILIALFASGFIYSQEEKKEEMLNEVVIDATSKTFVNKNGNIKLDVANSIFNAVPNTLDLLSKLPKIQLSPDRESITVVGKGNPLLYIDNQKVDMNALNTLDVADIKSIEIINNPSSKYEAEGRVVILITRKLSKKEGFKVDITENAAFKRYFNNSFGVNTSLKKQKVEFKANFNYNRLTVWESNGNDFSVPAENITSNYLTKAVTKRPQFLFGSGIFYKINQDDYLSITFNGRTQKERFDITTDTYNNDVTTENSIKTLNRNSEKRGFYNAFINYNHKIKSVDGQLFTGFQISDYNQQVNGIIFNDFNAAGMSLSQIRDQKFDITVFSGRADFEKVFKNDIKLELGGLFLKAEGLTYFQAEIQNPQTIQISDYKHKEQNISGYTQILGSYKKVNYSFGIRTEQTIINGKNASEQKQLVHNDYNNLFPKVQFDFPIDSTKTIALNYSKSIARPNYSATNQVLTYINPYFAFANNIHLNPTVTDEIAGTFDYKNKSLRVAYTRRKNPVYYGTFYNDSEKLLTLMTSNFKKESGYNIEITLPFTYKFWTVTNVLSGILNKIEDETTVINHSKPYLYGYSNSVFKLPKAIEVSVTGWGMTDQYEGVFKSKGLFVMDVAISKTIFKHFDCTVNVNDIFRKTNYYNTYTMNGISTNGKYFTDAHMISLSVKYAFGKIKNSEFQEKSIDENANRIR